MTASNRRRNPATQVMNPGTILVFALLSCLAASSSYGAPISVRIASNSIASNGRGLFEEKREQEVIHLGDLIEVDVVGSAEFDWRGKVTPEGFLEGFKFTENGIYALCLQPEDVAARVAEAYKRFLNEPTVKVTILDRSGRLEAVIYGAVRTQQRFRMRRVVNLSELLVLSGGLIDTASGEIRILRDAYSSCMPPPDPVVKGIGVKTTGTDRPGYSAKRSTWFINISIPSLLAGDKASNPRIYYGDVITVMESKPVYVMGGVANPTRIAFREGLTLSRAVSSAGGLTRNADAARITVFRRVRGRSKVIKVSLQSIKTGSADDVVLIPYDIVDVSQKGRREPKYPPVLGFEPDSKRRFEDLPVRIVD